MPKVRVLSSISTYSRACGEFSAFAAEQARRFHKTIPGYRETSLVSLSCAAGEYGIDSIFVKDESQRFGLKAFKGLGGSYAMFRILCERLGLDPGAADYDTFREAEVRRRCSGVEFVTATDGNHGKGVSWAAKLFGCKAHVYMPKGSVEARRRAIEEAGSAVAEITELNYDMTVEYAALAAERNGWELIQDTAWEGYEKCPRWIIDGYLTLAAEAAEQMGEKKPTHIFLQAGVGAMAGGIEAYFMNKYREEPPLVAIAEPTDVACIYKSVLAGDGKAHSIEGNPQTIMAGLNCGTPCAAVWPILRDCSAYFCACEDSVTEEGMRAYARPLGSDKAIVSGESGAVTYGLLLEILKSDSLREQFKIDEKSVILLINTEGDTDPVNYRKVLGE
ncbi:MAG: diaminopropionate ammonia-lyase [Firmicutes bacterium]|nr:diaminopropionate ammonia-lyase [Bacillota bacterium]